MDFIVKEEDLPKKTYPLSLNIVESKPKTNSEFEVIFKTDIPIYIFCKLFNKDKTSRITGDFKLE